MRQRRGPPEREAALDEIEALIPVIAAAQRHNDGIGARGFNWYTQVEGEQSARHLVESLRCICKSDVQKTLLAVRREAEKARKLQTAMEAMIKDTQDA